MIVVYSVVMVHGDAGNEFRDAVRELTDRYRDRCLWFLREDFYPVTNDEVLRTLGYIQEQGDVEGFREAGRLKQWLLHDSKSTSVN